MTPWRRSYLERIADVCRRHVFDLDHRGEVANRVLHRAQRKLYPPRKPAAYRVVKLDRGWKRIDRVFANGAKNIVGVYSVGDWIANGQRDIKDLRQALANGESEPERFRRNT